MKRNLSYSFWFYASIFSWFLIILISGLIAFFVSQYVGVRVSEFGIVLYILAVLILALWFREDHRDWSRGILKGFWFVFLFWLVFLIIFSISFFLGFKYF